MQGLNSVVCAARSEFLIKSDENEVQPPSLHRICVSSLSLSPLKKKRVELKIKLGCVYVCEMKGSW